MPVAAANGFPSSLSVRGEDESERPDRRGEAEEPHSRQLGRPRPPNDSFLDERRNRPRRYWEEAPSDLSHFGRGDEHELGADRVDRRGPCGANRDNGTNPPRCVPQYLPPCGHAT